MRKLLYVFLPLALGAIIIWAGSNVAKGDAAEESVQTNVQEYSPIEFIENKGQWDARILFKAKMNGGEILFEQDKIKWHFFELPPLEDHDHPHQYSQDSSIELKGHVVSTHFEGNNPTAVAIGEKKSPTYHNYYLGNDPQQWASGVALYKEILYEDIYPGIQLKVYGFGDKLKYDFVVAPGADPSAIKLRYEGMDKLFLADGKLNWETSLRTIVEDAPYSYQYLGDHAQSIPTRYVLKGNVLSYKFARGYDKTKPLVIDPTMVFSTYSGSRSDNWGFTATYDDMGNSYAGGIEVSVNNALQNGYPITNGAYQIRNNGGEREIAISKFDELGLNLLYATYLGGSLDDQPHSLIANSSGELYIFGRTNSSNFPMVNAFDDSYNGGFDMFVAKLSFDGLNLLASTYLGGIGDDGVNGSPQGGDFAAPTKYNYGDDARGEIFLDRAGNVLIGGPTQSGNFPFTPGAYSQTVSGGQSGVIAKFSSDLSQLQWASSFGGNGTDAIYAIKVDDDNNILFAGGTSSSNLPANGVVTSRQGGVADGFIGKISANGRNLMAATYLGTNAYDQVYLMDTDGDGNVYVTGQTEGAFPIVNPPSGSVFRDVSAKQFVTKLNPQLTQIIYSTTVGSPNAPFPNISPTAMLVDICESVYVTGWGGVSNTVGSTGGMRLVNADQSNTDGSDLYIFVLSRDAQQMTYGSYLGGIGTGVNGLTGEHVDGGTCRFDKNGVVYHAVCAQCGTSANFPTTAQAYSPNNGFPDNCNLALFKLAFDLEGVRSEFTVENAGDTIFACEPFTAEFENSSYLGAAPNPDVTYEWDFGVGGNTSSSFEPTFVYQDAGIYTVRLIVNDPLSCNLADTSYKTVRVLPLPVADAGDDFSICRGALGQLQGSGGVAYSWTPTDRLSDPNSAAPTFTLEESTTFNLTVTNESGCAATDDVVITIIEPNPIEVVDTKRTCVGVPTLIQAWDPNGNIVSYNWSPSTGLSNPNIGSPIASPEVTTDYVVTAIDVQGCEIRDTVRVEVLPDPQTEITGVNKTCIGGVIELQASGGDFYVWSTGDTAAVLEIPAVLGQQTYIATAFFGECEGIPDTIVVDERFDFPEASFVPDPSQAFAPASINFQNTTIGGDLFEWDFGFGNELSFEENPSFTYPFDGTYTIQLIAQTEFGCADTVTQIIEVEETRLVAPTAFTPNGDGINDEFFVWGRGISMANIKVFSKWGVLVYEAEEMGFSWDGTRNGKPLPEGVYVWVMEALGENGRKYPRKGTVSLVR